MRSLLAMTVWAASAAAALAQTKPAIAPGKPTAGFAVAVIADGFDYTRVSVAERFARDGEGEAIAYDAADDDRRPYARSADTSALIETAPTYVVPIRTDGTKESWRRAFAYLKRSPARVAVILAPIPTDLKSDISAELKDATDRLFLLPARATSKQALPNVITIAALPPAGTSPIPSETADLVLSPSTATREMPGAQGALPATAAEAALRATTLLACLDVSKARGPAHVAAALIAKGQRGLPGTAPIVEMCVVRR